MRKSRKLADVVLDVRGLLCPLPILRLQEAVQGLPRGKRVHLLSDDPGFSVDLPAWCADTGNHLVNLRALNGFYEAVVSVETRSRKSLPKEPPSK